METYWDAFIHEYTKEYLDKLDLSIILQAFWEYCRTDINRSTNDSIIISNKILKGE
jgi:hypothetical protein